MIFTCLHTISERDHIDIITNQKTKKGNLELYYMVRPRIDESGRLIDLDNKVINLDTSLVIFMADAAEVDALINQSNNDNVPVIGNFKSKSNGDDDHDDVGDNNGTEEDTNDDTVDASMKISDTLASGLLKIYHNDSMMNHIITRLTWTQQIHEKFMYTIKSMSQFEYGIVHDYYCRSNASKQFDRLVKNAKFRLRTNQEIMSVCFRQLLRECSNNVNTVVFMNISERYTPEVVTNESVRDNIFRTHVGSFDSRPMFT